MRFQRFITSCLAGTSFAASAVATTSLDLSAALSAASVLKSAYSQTSLLNIPFVTPGGNLLQPPSSIIAAIITGVPATVLVDLIQPSLRSSIGSDFKAGKTPSWYATLPPAVKSYIEALATQVSEGGVNLSATPTPNTSSGSIAGGTSAAKVKSTTSSKALAAQATGTVALGFMAAVGVLGVAIVL